MCLLGRKETNMKYPTWKQIPEKLIGKWAKEKTHQEKERQLTLKQK